MLERLRQSGVHTGVVSCQEVTMFAKGHQMPLASEKSAWHSLCQVPSHWSGQVEAFLIPEKTYINIIEILVTYVAYQVCAAGGNLHHGYNRFSTRVSDYAQPAVAVDLATHTVCTSDDMKRRKIHIVFMPRRSLTLIWHLLLWPRLARSQSHSEKPSREYLDPRPHISPESIQRDV